MKKVKWKSAEHKRQQEINQQAWNELLNKWKPATVKVSTDRPYSTFTVASSRSTKQYPSVIGGPIDTFKRDVKQYTGDKVVGIGVMHKSCLVPIFNSEQATDLAKMRR